MSLFKFKKTVDLVGYTLIIPSVSVGNVPQLMMDLLITTFQLENIGSIWHPGLVASVGADPFYSNSQVICTACELYISETFKLAVIQLRSTLETKLVRKFMNDLKESIITSRFKQVCILATGFDYELHNVANKNTLYFITNAESNAQIVKSMLSKQLERDHNSGKLIVSGSGFATKLYETLEPHINATLLVKYVSEGDNIFDAKCFLKELLQYIGIKEESSKPLSYPASWHYIYGAPPPLGLF